MSFPFIMSELGPIVIMFAFPAARAFERVKQTGFFDIFWRVFAHAAPDLSVAETVEGVDGSKDAAGRLFESAVLA